MCKFELAKTCLKKVVKFSGGSQGEREEIGRQLRAGISPNVSLLGSNDLVSVLQCVRSSSTRIRWSVWVWREWRRG